MLHAVVAGAKTAAATAAAGGAAAATVFSIGLTFYYTTIIQAIWFRRCIIKYIMNKMNYIEHPHFYNVSLCVNHK